MNKNLNKLKISGYDSFKCIADKCKFTCCEGWDVSIDSDTYSKWNKLNDKNLLSNIKVNNCRGKKTYSIDKETKDACPFLDNKGLCNVVKSNGDEYLSLTCRTFPRIYNKFDDVTEVSLSCSCPEVVEIISNINEEINIISESENDLLEEFLELKIRKNIINIINKENIPLDIKLIISFQMLLNILDNEEITEDVLLNEFENFSYSSYINELIKLYKKIDTDKGNTIDSIEEINNLFLDIIENYKDVPMLKCLLKDISHYAEEVNFEDINENWKEFKNKFSKHNKLIKNCIISKVLSNCISDDVEELTLSLQLIILEYLLIRYAVFLKYSISGDNNVSIEDIKDYIVCFSRVIGNNNESVIEFLEEGFGDPILEIGYLCFIGLF